MKKPQEYLKFDTDTLWDLGSKAYDVANNTVLNGMGESVGKQLNEQSRKLTKYLPERLQAPAKAVRSFLTGDTIAQAQKLLAHLRHRQAYNKLQDSLVQFRYFAGILIAREHELFEVLDERPMDAETIADRCGIHPRSTPTLLRMLESGELIERKDGLYKLSDFASEYLTDGGIVSIDPFLEFMSAFTSSFDEIIDGMRTGELPPKMDIFSDEGRFEVYLEAVNFYLDIATRELIAKADLPRIDSMIVGSMGVSFSGVMMNEYPHTTVTYGCLDHLVDEIPSLRMEYDIDPDRVNGMHRHGGDPEDDEWGEEAFDLVFLTKKMLLEPDEKMGERFARKAYDVLNPGGICIFWETIHPDDEITPFRRATNGILDLAASPTGFTLTEDSFESKLREIGFTDVEYIHCMGNETTFAIAHKNGS